MVSKTALLICAMCIGLVSSFPVPEGPRLWAKPCGSHSQHLSKARDHTAEARKKTSDLLARWTPARLDEIIVNILEYYKILDFLPPEDVSDTALNKMVANSSVKNITSEIYMTQSKLAVYVEKILYDESGEGPAGFTADVKLQEKALIASLCEQRQYLMEVDDVPEPPPREIIPEKWRNINPETRKMDRYIRDFVVLRDAKKVLQFHENLLQKLSSKQQGEE